MRALFLLALLAGCTDGSEKSDRDYGPVRFVALGDTGEGNDAQYAVAEVMETVCGDQGCDFALMLGDNFYDVGVKSAQDPQWEEKFELPYENLDFPFYAALGNHDYGNAGDVARAEAQITYDLTDQGSGKWTMPAAFYKHRHENVDFVALDTHPATMGVVLEDRLLAQEAWLKKLELGSRKTHWRIAYGHHPYWSNGNHGNAGNYDGFESIVPLSGQQMKDLTEAELCGTYDLYVCGHDHHQELLSDTCDGTRFIVSGAGAKLRELPGNNPAAFKDAKNEGFAWFEIEDDMLRVQFWNKLGDLMHEAEWKRGS